MNHPVWNAAIYKFCIAESVKLWNNTPFVNIGQIMKYRTKYVTISKIELIGPNFIIKPGIVSASHLLGYFIKLSSTLSHANEIQDIS